MYGVLRHDVQEELGEEAAEASDTESHAYL